MAEPVDISDASLQGQRHRFVLDSTEIPIMIVDENMKFVLVNALFEAHTGYSRDDVEGKKSWSELVVDEDLDRLKKYHSLRRIDPGAVPAGFEFQFEDNWGNLKNTFVSVTMIPGTKMSVTSFFNITNVKPTEEIVSEPKEGESIDEYRSKAIAMVLDKNVRFVFMDSLLSKLIEDASIEQQERSVIAFFPKEFAEKILESITQVHEHRKAIKYDSALHMSGRNMNVQVQTVPIFDKNKNVLMVLVTMNDVTQLKRAEQSKLQDMALGDVNMLRNEFMTSMSHELRTPLNNIIGYTEMLLDQIYGKINDKQSQQLVYIHSSGLILLELINDFLDLSLLDMGELNPVSESFTLDEPVADIQTICEPMASNLRHRIKANVEPGVRVWADQMLVKQCLYNLLMNAIRFTPAGGRITINVDIVDDMAHISVRNNGIIIESDIGDEIFTPFYHMKTATSVDIGTTGLGLTITQKLVEMMGGRLWLESHSSKGSEFFFNLPINPPVET